MKRFFFIALLLLSSGPAYAELVAVAKTGDNATIYIDTETISRDGEQVELWFIFDYKRPRRLASDVYYLSMKRHYQYDCANEFSRLLATTFFLSNMGRGHVLDEIAKEDHWRPVPSDGAGRALMKSACKK
jgi:hypothetical protein